MYNLLQAAFTKSKAHDKPKYTAIRQYYLYKRIPVGKYGGVYKDALSLLRVESEVKCKSSDLS